MVKMTDFSTTIDAVANYKTIIVVKKTSVELWIISVEEIHKIEYIL